MKFEEACEAAMEYFKTGYGDTGLCSIKDLGDRWLFNGANGEEEAIYGKQGLSLIHILCRVLKEMKEENREKD